ncbi:MAG: hypothetical protein IKX20_12280 [Paludibacteraceae bacterium]|nr:hypothetical protein [Paludibacteraceae bacterium]
MSYSHSLSAAEQHNLISIANIAVSRCAKAFSDKIGVKGFFRREEIEDIAGNVVYKAWRSLGGYDPKTANLSTWLGKIAFNCVNDAIDYKMKRLPISYPLYSVNTDEGEEFDATEYCPPSRVFNSEEQVLFSEYGADKGIIAREFAETVRGEFGKLSEKNQRFVSLLEAGYTPKQMAIVEGCTANAASKRIFDIRRVLKASLAEVAQEFGYKIAC